MQTIFVAMLYFPEVQLKAQEELDRVLRGRLPDYDDLKDPSRTSLLLSKKFFGKSGDKQYLWTLLTTW